MYFDLISQELFLKFTVKVTSGSCKSICFLVDVPAKLMSCIIKLNPYCFLVAVAVVVAGSFSNDDGDGDGNQDVKKAIALLRKTTTLHVHHPFLYISLPSLHDYDV